MIVSELGRRRPDLDLRAFAPFGQQTRRHRDEPVERLEDVDRYGHAHLSDALDLVVVSLAGENYATLDPPMLALLLGGPDGTAPVVWHAVGVPDDLSDATRDTIVSYAATARRISLVDGSEERWKVIGTRSPACVVPDPAVLAPRLFTRPLLKRRVEFLRAIGAWPRAEQAIVVQSSGHTRGAALSAGSEAPPMVALVADSPNDEAFADAVAAMPNGRRLPRHAGVEDQVAAIAGAAGVLAESPVVREVARAFGVPAAPLSAVADSPRPIAQLQSLLSAASPVTDLADRIDADFDAIAQLAPGPITNAFESSQLAAMRAALAARSRRLDAERVATADALLRERAHAQSAEQRLEELHGEYLSMRAAYDDVRNLEVVRLRVALGHMRDRLLRRRSR